MAWYMINLKLQKSEYSAYIDMLSSDNKFQILISKRLLFRTVWLFWLLFLIFFSLLKGVFFGVVVLPSLILFGIYLHILFPIWNACNISPKAYIIFHLVVLLILKLLSIPFGYLLEVLWTLCF